MGFRESISKTISAIKIAIDDLVSTDQYPGAHRAWFKIQLFGVSKKQFSGHRQRHTSILKSRKVFAIIITFIFC